MVTLVHVRCTKCGLGLYRHNYHWKGRSKKYENRPQVLSKCPRCGRQVKRV